jgi:hypothetical protein
MIAVEVLIVIFVVTVVLVGIAKIGAPIADAFAERLKLKFQELEPSEERQLKARIETLEEEIRNLKRQVSSMQESVEFAVKMQQEPGEKIHIPEKKKV